MDSLGFPLISVVRIELLRGLAGKGRTVILTIHQPRSDLLAHVGNVFLLARGGLPVYAGNGSGTLKHFQMLEFSFFVVALK